MSLSDRNIDAFVKENKERFDEALRSISDSASNAIERIKEKACSLKQCETGEKPGVMNQAVESISKNAEELHTKFVSLSEESLRKLGSDVVERVKSGTDMLDRIEQDQHGYQFFEKRFAMEAGRNPADAAKDKLRTEGFREHGLGNPDGYAHQMFRDVDGLREHIRFNDPKVIDEKTCSLEIVGELHRKKDGALIYGAGIYGDLEPKEGVEHALSAISNEMKEATDMVGSIASSAKTAVENIGKDLSNDPKIDQHRELIEHRRQMEEALCTTEEGKKLVAERKLIETGIGQEIMRPEFNNNSAVIDATLTSIGMIEDRLEGRDNGEELTEWRNNERLSDLINELNRNQNESDRLLRKMGKI
jgi:hypothetical protein